jgi:type II secretory pathway pseudopilin PulG
MKHSSMKRSGIVSIWVLVVLSVLAAMTATATWQYLAGRRLLRERQQALQAGWLARSGVEIAAARLLADPKDPGETLELIPESQVQVAIERLPGDAEQFRIVATARYPTSPKGHVRSSSRTFRRVMEGEKVRVEVVPEVGS